VLNEWVLTGSSWTGGMAWTSTTTAATCVYSQHCQSHLKRQADDIRIHLVRAQNMPFNYQGSKPLLGFKIAAFMISGFRCVEVVIIQSVRASSDSALRCCHGHSLPFIAAKWQMCVLSLVFTLVHVQANGLCSLPHAGTRQDPPRWGCVGDCRQEPAVVVVDCPSSCCSLIRSEKRRCL
jgi:hypothetical protein